MSRSHRRTFLSDFRQFFVRGLVILLPSVLTIWIVVQAYRFVEQNIAQPINGICQIVVIRVTPVIFRDPEHYPEWYVVTDEELAVAAIKRTDEQLPDVSSEVLAVKVRANRLRLIWSSTWYLKIIGLAVAVCLFYLAGRMLSGFLGRSIADRFERLLARVPVFKQVYPYVKQIVDFILGDRHVEFNSVALVEYPRKGVWAIGFITGQPANQWSNLIDDELVTMFIPSSPTPFTGYTIAIPLSEVRKIDVSVEEALRFTVSGGVVAPPSRGVRLSPKSTNSKEEVPSRSDSNIVEAEDNFETQNSAKPL